MIRFSAGAVVFFLFLGGAAQVSPQIDLKAEGYSLNDNKSTGAMIGGDFCLIPGSRANGTLKVFNRGNRRAPDVTLRAIDWPAGWKLMKPDDFDLNPGERINVGFNIQIPRDAAPRKYSRVIEVHHAKESHREDNFFSVVLNVVKDPYPRPDVDHSERQKYVQETKETTLNARTKKTLAGEIPGGQGMARIGKVFAWVDANFKRNPGGGEFVAERSAQKIYNDKTLTGCNDHGILKTAILRSFGYPVVFMNSANVAWAEQFQAGKASGPHKGHTFLEVFVDKKWIVLDSVTGNYYIEDYNFKDPVLRLKGPATREQTYFVYHKGQDHWTMGVHSMADNRTQMEKFARHYPLESIKVPQKKFKDVKKLAE